AGRRRSRSGAAARASGVAEAVAYGENNYSGFEQPKTRQATTHAAKAALVSPVRRSRRGLRLGGATGRIPNLASGNRRTAAGETMSKADLLVERGADRLEGLSR